MTMPQIKAEMEKTLQWLVPVATDTTKYVFVFKKMYNTNASNNSICVPNTLKLFNFVFIEHIKVLDGWESGQTRGNKLINSYAYRFLISFCFVFDLIGFVFFQQQ